MNTGNPNTLKKVLPMVTTDVLTGVSFNLEKILALSPEERQGVVLHERHHLHFMRHRMSPDVYRQTVAALAAMEAGVAGPPLVEKPVVIEPEI